MRTKNLVSLSLMLGLIAMPVILPYVLVAQSRLAATGEFREAFQLGRIRRRVRRAPFSHTFALIVVMALALPLYLLNHLGRVALQRATPQLSTGPTPYFGLGNRPTLGIEDTAEVVSPLLAGGHDACVLNDR